MTDAPTLGIDFGTTNSVFAVETNAGTEVLLNSEHERLTPSVVYYTQENERERPKVGKLAENEAEKNPDRVIRSVKREMGNGGQIFTNGESHTPEEVAAEILWKIRTDAAEALDVPRENLTRTVITRPAYWEEDRTRSIQNAAQLAGFESIRLIKEPAAAAIAYGTLNPAEDEIIGVFDLGGGTFDFALVTVDSSQSSDHDGIGGEEYTVLAQAGDPQLGGDDWDEEIVKWAVQKIVEEYGEDPRIQLPSDDGIEYKIREERLRSEARQVKEALSSSAVDEESFTLPFLMSVNGEPVSFEETLTQSEFESLTSHLLQKTVGPVKQALNDANLRKDDIDKMVLVGGSTKMPQVSDTIEEVLGITPESRVNPSEAVARGAAKAAERDDILLLEVTPLSLGIQIKGDRFRRLIPRNERVPASASQVFTTSESGQTAVRIPIYQGERETASKNRHLKTLVIDDIVPSDNQGVQIEVEFEVQKNGIINVRATENTRDQTVSVSLEGENDLKPEEVKARIQEAKEMEEEDRRRLKVQKALENAEDAISKGEEVLKYSELFSDADQSTLESHISNVKKAIHGERTTVADLREETEKLEQVVLTLGNQVKDVEPNVLDDARDANATIDGEVDTSSESEEGGEGNADESSKSESINEEEYTDGDDEHAEEATQPEGEPTDGSPDESGSDGSKEDFTEPESIEGDVPPEVERAASNLGQSEAPDVGSSDSEVADAIPDTGETNEPTEIDLNTPPSESNEVEDGRESSDIEPTTSPSKDDFLDEMEDGQDGAEEEESQEDDEAGSEPSTSEGDSDSDSSQYKSSGIDDYEEDTTPDTDDESDTPSENETNNAASQLEEDHLPDDEGDEIELKGGQNYDSDDSDTDSETEPGESWSDSESDSDLGDESADGTTDESQSETTESQSVDLSKFESGESMEDGDSKPSESSTSDAEGEENVTTDDGDEDSDSTSDEEETDSEHTQTLINMPDQNE